MIRRAFDAVLTLWLRWCIWEAENYMHACAKDGLIDSLSLRAFRGQIADMRVRLYALQPSMNPATPAGAKGVPKHEPHTHQQPAADECGRRLGA